MRETLETVDGRSVLRMERRLPHPPDRVWRALTEPAELAHWFPTPARIEPRAGGEVVYGEPGGDVGEVRDFQPPHLLAFTWGGDLLRWEVRPDGDGALLILRHTFDDRFGAPSFAAGWHSCLDALAAALAGTAPADGSRDMAALLEKYIDVLGMAAGTADDDGVRFERQLSRPIPEVWDALGGTPTGGRVPAGFTVAEFPPLEVADVKAPRLLEYDARPGRVRWELREGTGHGARLVLTHTCPPEHRRAALAAWQDHLTGLARRLLAG
ncbi:hypothetical protein Sru01_37670 [Sphaerisporangium rufum]|uniref:Activator of Hsp90 ATPase homologue 1/2-like C-terminal domain-containing protein n=1 Tax=Sphaerisporangium rufum TaxID=1381558 RepID=A0A919R7P4_9ACTN|nr:SRPBCC family protein [Sphaerisporangium rufum]GII78785.1 hypothetical protein Sru01_37670 [Sphaerisporangium rufum]